MAGLKIREIFEYLEADFRTAWQGVHLRKLGRKGKGRGNYLFSLHSMVMLEAAYFYLDGKQAKQNFSTKLFEIEPRYGFALAYKKTPSATEFIIPYSQNTGGTLLALLFDVIRNGHAHEYETKPVNLSCGGTLEVGLTGANKNFCLKLPSKRERREKHLVQHRDSTASCLVLSVRSDILFLDFLEAIKESGLQKNDSPAKSSGNVRNLNLDFHKLKTKLGLSEPT